MTQHNQHDNHEKKSIGSLTILNPKKTKTMKTIEKVKFQHAKTQAKNNAKSINWICCLWAQS